MNSRVFLIGAAVLAGSTLAVASTYQSQRASSPPSHGTKSISRSPVHLSAEANARLKEIEHKAEYNSRPFRDLMLTGSGRASAEWAGANGGICGIQPYLRYVVVENSIGKTRYDEPSDQVWNSLGCEETAPRNQQALLSRQAAADQKAQANAEHLTKALFSNNPEVARAALAWSHCRDAVWARPASAYQDVHISPSDKAAWAEMIKATIRRECGSMP